MIRAVLAARRVDTSRKSITLAPPSQSRPFLSGGDPPGRPYFPDVEDQPNCPGKQKESPRRGSPIDAARQNGPS